jgi:RNA polymerase sigma-70 factor (ECF subfamily)
MNRPGPDPLLAELAAGRAEAFAELYDRFGGRLHRAAWGILGRSEDAEEAVQEVFMALVRCRARLSEVRDLTAYLFTALRRVAARLAARQARQPVAAEEVVRQAAINAGRPPTSNPQGERLDRALRALPPKQREVIVMKIDGDLTFAQIAAVVGVSANTAASRYRYALQRLRRALGETTG